MEWQIPITKRKEMFSFQIQEPITSLWVFVSGTFNEYCKILIINPKQEICGEIQWVWGGFLKECYISEACCTLNGVWGPLEAGEYQIEVIQIEPNRPLEGELQFKVEWNVIREYPQRYLQDPLPEDNFAELVNLDHRYYLCDFHGHTEYSDGSQNRDQALETLERQGVEAMAFTEHNGMAFGRKKTDVLIVPAFELTLTTGHVNFHGIKRPVALMKEFRYLTNETTDEVFMLEMAEKYYDNCHIAINHPLMEPWHLHDENMDLKYIHSLEIICDPTYPTAPDANKSATAFLDFLWNEGLRVYGIGGSDSHLEPHVSYEGTNEHSLYGDPATYVFCKGLSINEVVKGLRFGHSFVSRYFRLDISINGGTILPGDAILENVKFLHYEVVVYMREVGGNRIDAQSTDRTFRGIWIVNGKVSHEVPIDLEEVTGRGQACHFTLEREKVQWMRFGIVDEAGVPIAYVNPIYTHLKRSETTLWGPLTTKFLEEYDKRHII